MEWTIPITLCVIIGVIAGYLLGSCNFAIITTKIFTHEDIRKQGSGNAGLTNVLRTQGKGAVILTLIGDFSKGILSVVLVRILLHFFAQTDDFFIADYLVAYGALLGHVYPVYYGFKGGKGILVSFGAVMILSPIAGLICLSGFIIAVAISKYVSLGSIIAGILFPISVGLMAFMQGTTAFWQEALLGLPVGAFIVYLHRQNIVRLLNHNENKISFKKKQAKKQ